MDYDRLQTIIQAYGTVSQAFTSAFVGVAMKLEEIEAKVSAMEKSIEVLQGMQPPIED